MTTTRHSNITYLGNYALRDDGGEINFIRGRQRHENRRDRPRERDGQKTEERETS